MMALPWACYYRSRRQACSSGLPWLGRTLFPGSRGASLEDGIEEQVLQLSFALGSQYSLPFHFSH